jgi:anti-anti-sigma factor
MDADFITTSVNKRVVLHCTGELDLVSRTEFAVRLGEIASAAMPWVVIDLEGVTFMDCGAVTLLERMARRMGPTRSVVVVAPHGIVRRLLTVVDLDPSVRFASTFEEAVSGRVLPHRSLKEIA